MFAFWSFISLFITNVYIFRYLQYRPLKSSCDFSHNLTSNGYDTFKLRDKAEWSIGFKKRRGKKLPGFIRPGKNEDECHHFSLINLEKTVITQPVDFLRVKEWNFSKKGKSMSEQRKRPRKIRHNRNQKRRRGRRRKNKSRTVGTTWYVIRYSLGFNFFQLTVEPFLDSVRRNFVHRCTPAAGRTTHQSGRAWTVRDDGFRVEYWWFYFFRKLVKWA